jgi:hypothetical protein
MGKAIATHRAFGRELERVLPAAAIARYRDFVGGILGDNLDDVIAFALVSFLHDHATTSNHFEHAGLKRARGEFIAGE